MKDFTIYHVPSLKKIGCTRNFKKRCRERYPGLCVIVLETIPAKRGPKYAGDVEWAYATKFGYKRRGHYLNTWDFKITKQQRRLFAAQGHLGWTPEGRERIFEASKQKGPKGVGAPGMGAETKARIAKAGAKAAVNSPNHPNNRRLTCPHCGRTSNIGAMKRWHFNNCRLIIRSTNG
jgi:hypothetical protein